MRFSEALRAGLVLIAMFAAAAFAHAQQPIVSTAIVPARIAPSRMHSILATIVYGTGYYQVVHDGNRVHELYRSRHDVVLGSYLQRTKGQWFEAQCVLGPVTVMPTEKQAARTVEACPDPGRSRYP